MLARTLEQVAQVIRTAFPIPMHSSGARSAQMVAYHLHRTSRLAQEHPTRRMHIMASIMETIARFPSTVVSLTPPGQITPTALEITPMELSLNWIFTQPQFQ